MRDPDLILIEEFLSGDSKAFDSIVEKYSPAVYRLAYKFTHNVDDASDLTQDTFLKAYEALVKGAVGTGERELLLKPWLMTICVNLCRNLAKKKKSFRFSDLEDENGEDSLVERLQSHEAGPREKADENELVALVQGAVKHLPPKYQVVIQLRYMDELSYEEIAKVLKIPLNTVKIHLNRAKKTLQSYLPPL